ncbi:MAG TPA: DUF1571 domain-containing protein [Gammaproteobacteria bacterium]|nr:DUF1571 domain-containing protein [Gammaproteobacteria bacterium]
MQHAILLTLLFTTFTTRADSIAPETFFNSVIARMQTATSQLRDTTYTFHKQEYADGHQQPIEHITVKYRAPNDIYMKWLEPIHRGRELLFRSGWNDEQLRISPGRWLPTLNLDPHGRLAMRGNRHSIHQLPFPAIVANFADSAALIRANPALQAPITDLGEQRHFGETGHCYQLRLPKDREPGLYAAEVMLCVSLRTGLPLRIRSWDEVKGRLRQVEDYGYKDVQVNVGLSDRDFDPDNPDYNF